MNKFRNYRRVVLSGMAILGILATGTQSAAAQATNDISIQIVANRDVVKPGQKVTYTVTMTNRGPSDATFVDVGFQLPDQLQLVSMECDLGISPDTPFCEYSALASGQTVVSTLVAAPTSRPRGNPVVLTTTAAVSFESADSFDPDTANNISSVQTKLIGRQAHP